MPRHTQTSKLVAMESRLSAVEASLADLPQMLQDAVASNNASLHASWDLKLQAFFEHLRLESVFVGGGGGQNSDPLSYTADDVDFRCLETPRPRRDGSDGGGLHARPPWQPCLDFPRFSEGDDPLAWIYRAEQYFSYYAVPDHQRVVVVSFHLDGEPLQWFRWRNCLQSTPTWSKFTFAFCQEFGPLEFEDRMESLFKLRQSGTLKDYILEFRKLATRSGDVGLAMLKSCFI